MRLSRSEFRAIQVELEARVLREQPELEQALAIGKRSDRRSARQEEAPAPYTARSTVLERARYAAEQATGEQALHAALKAEGLELYVRGKQLGVIDLYDGSKHRLKTLDPALPSAFEACLSAEIGQGERGAPDGENKNGAQALPSSPHEPEPQPETPATQQEEVKVETPALAPVQELWAQEIAELRERTEEQVRQHTDEATEARRRLRDITAMVKLAVAGTLLGLKTRYMQLLAHLHRRRTTHETSAKFTRGQNPPPDTRHR